MEWVATFSGLRNQPLLLLTPKIEHLVGGSQWHCPLPGTGHDGPRAQCQNFSFHDLCSIMWWACCLPWWFWERCTGRHRGCWGARD